MMRLLRREAHGDFKLHEFDSEDTPDYAILSHTWADGEVTYGELVAGTGKNKAGYDKIRFCEARAASDRLRYFWVDTCCINKNDPRELQTAFNSMFRWYRGAKKCYVSLSDVQVPEEVVDPRAFPITWQYAFQRSRWFTRGWTLQELLASPVVEFFSQDGRLLGSKVTLEQVIHEITKIPVEALRGYQPLSEFSVSERMSWVANRRTAYKEDKAYCLFGIFDVSIFLNYGEGTEKAFRRLEEEIQRSTGQEQWRASAALPDLSVSSLLPFSRNECFVGREDELQLLEKQLSRQKSCRRMTVYGLGGCGKSALALEFAYQTMDADAKCSVFWVPAISRESFELAYRDIGAALRIPGMTDSNADVLQLVKKALESDIWGNWLMIIDNADDAGILLGDSSDGRNPRRLIDCLPRSDSGTIIFTTRTRKVAQELTPMNSIKLGDMNTIEAEQLVERHLWEKEKLEDKSAVGELLKLLVYLPLAIIQAIAFINRNDILMADYISLFRYPGANIELFSKHFEDSSRYGEMESTIARTWYISFEQILMQDRLAADYLAFMTCIDRVDIPQSLLPLADPLLQTEAIGTLKGYTFITERQRAPKHAQVEKFFNMHRLVQMTSMWWLQEHNQWTMWASKAVTRLEELVPYGGHEDMEAWRLYLPHAIHLAGLDNALDESSKATLLDRVGRCYVSLGQYSKAETTHRQVLGFQRKTFGEEDKRTLTSMNNLALALHDQGKYKAAESINRQTIAIREKVLGVEHLSTLTTMSNLAVVLDRQGKHKEAELINRQTLAIREKVLGVEHPHTLTTMSNLAVVLHRQGKYEEVESMNRQILVTQEKVLGVEHPHTLATMSNLAFTLGVQGKYKEAESINRQSLATSEKILGVEHPDTLMARYGFAYILANRNQYVESAMLYNEACAGFQSVLGRDHPTTIACRQHYEEMVASRDQSQTILLSKNATKRRGSAISEEVLPVSRTRRNKRQVSQRS